MSFPWTPPQRALRDQWIRFARRKLPPQVRGKTGVAALARSGLLTPERVSAGGSLAAFDAFGHAGVDSGVLFMAQAHLWGAWVPLSRLRPDLAGDLRASRNPLLGFAVTEAASGSDVYAMRTFARPTKDGWELRGEKTFVTNAPLAAAFLVLARDGKAGEGFSCFFVPRRARGLSLRPAPERLGLSTAAVAGLRLEGVRVRETDLVGPRGGGSDVFRLAMLWERSMILSSAGGRLERLADAVEKDARRKIRLGRPLAEAAAFRAAIGGVRAAADEIRDRVLRAAALLDAGTNAVVSSLETKIEASTRYEEASRTLLRLGGKEAFYAGSELERNFRDSLAGSLYSGPNDLLRELLTRVRDA